MGNASRKAGDIPEDQSGLTENQMKLIKDTWHRFCDSNREYGVLLFLSLFIKHPEYVAMFRNFRGKPVGTLKDDPIFRAHGCAIGYHITALVDSLGDPAKFEILARRNATEHLKRKGVKPAHFEVMGMCMVDVLRAKDEKRMTPAAVEAWVKFLSYFVAIIKDVYEQAAADRCEASAASNLATGAIDDATFAPGLRSRAASHSETPLELTSAKPGSSTVAIPASSKRKLRSSSGGGHPESDAAGGGRKIGGAGSASGKSASGKSAGK